MNSNRVEINFKILNLLILFIAVILLIGGVALNVLLKSAESEDAKRYIMRNTNLLKVHFTRQLEADFQTLNTVKSFLGFDETSHCWEMLEDLVESNMENEFIRMSLIYKDGAVYHATVNEEIEKQVFHELDPNLQNAINESWEGSNAVSEIYYDPDLMRTVLVVSVPIKKGNEVVGVLAAYNDISVFNDLLKEITDVNAYVYVIDDNGKFLIRSEDRILQYDIQSIYSAKENYLNTQEVRMALQGSNDYYNTVFLNGEMYSVYFSPMNYHNWYILEVVPFYSIQSALVSKINNSTLVYVGIVILGGICIINSFRLFRRNSDILKKIAYYDELTGLINIHKFKWILENQMEKRYQYSIVILNVKNFQLINDTFGEKYGDILLCDIAMVMNQMMREDEYCCRENSDQFVMLLQGNNKEEILSRIESLKNTVKRYFADSGSNYNMQFSIGICTEMDEPKKMMSNALWAMKRAKHMNESYLFFDNQLLDSITTQNEIESSMHVALKEKEFKVYLQPKYDIESMEIAGAEALVRWIKRDGNMFYPDQFIPLFERNGFCIELDLYILEQVCKKLREWMDKGIKVHPISVNQTKLLFYRTDYVDKVCNIVSRYDISPKLIVLEILEGLAVEDLDTFRCCLEELHVKGFRVSLDDFGSGYSSLSNLYELQVDEIKIDRKFLNLLGGENDVQKNNIFKKIISLVGTLESDVVIEGVETQAQVEFLRSMNCKYAQGYYFSKPVSVENYESMLVTGGKPS